MKILLIADNSHTELWGAWSPETRALLKDVKLILSAGDLSPFYLEFLVTMMNVPLVYVRGNHDEYYHERPPEGCIDADGQIVYVDIFDKDTGKAAKTIRVAGLGGSMSYREGPDMYTEPEMAQRVRKLRKTMRKVNAGRNLRELFRIRYSGRRLTGAPRKYECPGFDILLTHAPCLGYGDMEDMPHRGFACFNDLLEEYRPAVHCYGHVHMEYGNFKRELSHPSGTRLINGSGYYIFEAEI